MMFPHALGIQAGLQEIQMWQAPFPPPQAVCEYEEILPGTWVTVTGELLSSRRSQLLGNRGPQRDLWRPAVVATGSTRYTALP
jgi:hypothetical protein